MSKRVLAVLAVILPCILLAAEARKSDATVKFAGETIGKALVGKIIGSDNSGDNQAPDNAAVFFVDKIVEFKPKAKATMFGKTPIESSAKYFAGIKDKKVAWLRVVLDQTADTKALIAALDKHYGKAKAVANKEARIYSKGKTWLVYRDKDLRISDRKNYARVDMSYMLGDLLTGKVGDYTLIEKQLSALPKESHDAMEDLFLNILFKVANPDDPNIYNVPRDPNEMLSAWVPREFELALKGEGAVKICRERREADKIEGIQLWKDGPYWAECNIGANKPEGEGYYFWWGDTVGYTYDGKAWNASDGSKKNFELIGDNCVTYGKETDVLVKEGYIDSKWRLVKAYDAATVKLGDTWRIPTRAEIQALGENCDSTFTNRNGVAGTLIKGRGEYASKSIFLPALGYGTGHERGEYGERGRYWCSAPYIVYLVGRGPAYCAGYFLADFRGARHIPRVDNCARHFALQIRPVKSTPLNDKEMK